MKTTLITLNAKYIHTSLALRWLYLANREQHNISFIEYTIKEKIEHIVQEIKKLETNVLGISVSIWNVDESKILITALKKEIPELIVILGGPEVSYEPEFFLDNWDIDYVISGEGEFVLGELLDAIEHDKSKEIASVSYKGRINRQIAQADIERLTALPSPYQLEEDSESMQNKVIYFETSRGCPYNCQYCLSSLEKGVRYFPKEHIEENLKYLIDNNAKLIKFLDRTFNLNKEHTYHVFNFLIENHRENLSCQFEIYADILKEEVIDYLNTNLPENYFRFEIGIQSTHEPTNIAVHRRQDFDILSKNVRHLMSGKKIDLHLDLIAGLPHENYERFVKSFNDVFALGAKEVQLGFLKMLRGTNLRRDAEFYGYKFDQNAPYEIIFNGDISKPELDRIREAEKALEKFWNSGRFQHSMQILINTKYKGRYFELFDEIAQYYISKDLPHRGYQLEDLYRHFQDFLKTKGIDLFTELRTDYYQNFRRRPHGFWEDRMDIKTKRRLYYGIGQDIDFLEENNLTRRSIEKQTAIDFISESEVLLTVFSEDIDPKIELHKTYIYNLTQDV